MFKLKFISNMAKLGATNNSLDKVIFDSKEMLGILDLRLTGYFRVKHARYKRKEGNCMVQTKLITKSSDITLPKVYKVNKEGDTGKQLDKQVIKPLINSEVKGVTQSKPKLVLYVLTA